MSSVKSRERVNCKLGYGSFKDQDEAAIELWNDYKTDKSNISVRNALIEHYYCYVYLHVDRVMKKNGHHDQGTMLSWGFDGLIQAISKYDPDSGTSFYTYSYARIAGSIVDGMRNTTNRYNLKQSKIFEDTRSNLQQQQFFTVGDEEVAEHMGITYDKWKLHKNTYTVKCNVSLDNSSPDKEKESFYSKQLVGKQKSPDFELSEQEQFEHYIHEFDDRTKTVMRMSYVDGFSYEEIAKHLDVSESYIFIIHQRAIYIISDKLGKPQDPTNTVEQKKRERILVQKAGDTCTALCKSCNNQFSYIFKGSNSRKLCSMCSRKTKISEEHQKLIKENPSKYLELTMDVKKNRIGDRIDIICQRCDCNINHVIKKGRLPIYCDGCRAQIGIDRNRKLLSAGVPVPKVNKQEQQGNQNETRSGHQGTNGHIQDNTSGTQGTETNRNQEEEDSRS